MLVKTVLNRLEYFKSFVFEALVLQMTFWVVVYLLI